MDPQSYIQEQQLFTHDNHLVVAVSGGKDSMALLHWLYHQNYNISVVHINYHLRDSSDMDMDCVQNVCSLYDIDCYIKEVETENIPDAGIQEWARKVRYRFLNQVSDLLQKLGDDVVIITAHHLEDHFETFFIKFLKTRLFTSLSGMKNSSEIARPFLQTSVDEIQAYIEEHNIEYVEDQSNQTDAYLRNKIRHHILPSVKSLMDAYPEQLRRSMNLISDHDELRMEYLQLLKDRHFANIDNKLIINNISSLSYNSSKYLVDHILYQQGVQSHPSAIDDMLTSGSGAQWHMGDRIITKDRDAIIISKEIKHDDINILITESGSYPTPHGTLLIEHVKDINFTEDSTEEIISLIENNALSMRLRNHNEGDRMTPLGMPGKSKKISKILKDKKVDLVEKKRSLVLEDLNTHQVIWLVGYKLSEIYKYNSSHTAYRLRWLRDE